MFVVKVPGVNSRDDRSSGCKNSGNEVLAELKKISLNEQGRIIDFSLLDLEEIHVDDSKLEEKHKLIYKNSFKTFQDKQKVIFLGGDHSISYSLCKGFLDYCFSQEEVKEPCLIVFDAHGDCLGTEDNKKYFSTNRSWLRDLIEAGFPKESVLIVGVRDLMKEELIFLKENKIRFLQMSQFIEKLEDNCDLIMEFSQGKELYVSVDFDVVDPVFSPSVVDAVSGGFTSREFIYLMQRINMIKNLKAIDFVEIDSKKDFKKNGETIKFAAKVLAEVI